MNRSGNNNESDSGQRVRVRHGTGIKRLRRTFHREKKYRAHPVFYLFSQGPGRPVQLGIFIPVRFQLDNFFNAVFPRHHRNSRVSILQAVFPVRRAHTGNTLFRILTTDSTIRTAASPGAYQAVTKIQYSGLTGRFFYSRLLTAVGSFKQVHIVEYFHNIFH